MGICCSLNICLYIKQFALSLAIYYWHDIFCLIFALFGNTLSHSYFSACTNQCAMLYHIHRAATSFPSYIRLVYNKALSQEMVPILIAKVEY